MRTPSRSRPVLVAPPTDRSRPDSPLHDELSSELLLAN